MLTVSTKKKAGEEMCAEVRKVNGGSGVQSK